ncbi:MAG: hypothetical protein ACXW4H_02845 [Candidatus Limnocylindrales bacterium]
MLIFTVMPVSAVNASTIFWNAAFGISSERDEPTVIEPGATLAASDGATLAASLGAALGASLGELVAADELQAAIIAGMLIRPAAPAMPLRTVRRETDSTRMGSTMVPAPPAKLPDKIRQDHADCQHVILRCQGPYAVNFGKCSNALTFCALRGNLTPNDQRGGRHIVSRMADQGITY